jgi:hypothetical protein
MILGENEDKGKEPGGPLAGVKKKWAKLTPKRQKAITIAVFAVVILAFAASGYHSRKIRNAGQKPVASTKNTKEISLNTDLIEKSLFRQAQDTINQQGKVISDMRKEIADVKAATEKNAQITDQQKINQRKDLPPPPDLLMEPPGLSIPEPLPVQNYGGFPPPPYQNNKDGDQSNVMGGIAFITATPDPEEDKEASDKKKIPDLSGPFFYGGDFAFRAGRPDDYRRQE